MIFRKRFQTQPKLSLICRIFCEIFPYNIRIFLIFFSYMKTYSPADLHCLRTIFYHLYQKNHFFLCNTQKKTVFSAHTLFLCLILWKNSLFIIFAICSNHSTHSPEQEYNCFAPSVYIPVPFWPLLYAHYLSGPAKATEQIYPYPLLEDVQWLTLAM